MKNNNAEAELELMIEKLSIGGKNQFADCFNNFLDLQLQFFCNNPNDRQRDLFKHMNKNKDFKNDMIAAMQAFGAAAENFKDPLGNMFMNRISHGERGQFFTPDDISLLMAEIVGLKDNIKIKDPACGSGRTLLNALKVARSKGMDMELYANDISMTCAKMTLLNFVTNSVVGEVTCGDALTLNYEDFTFFKIDRLKNIGSGVIFSTYWQYTLADVKEVSKKRSEWWWEIAKHGWMNYHRPTKEGTTNDKKAPETYDALPTEIKVEENGQITLF